MLFKKLLHIDIVMCSIQKIGETNIISILVKTGVCMNIIDLIKKVFFIIVCYYLLLFTFIMMVLYLAAYFIDFSVLKRKEKINIKNQSGKTINKNL